MATFNVNVGVGRHVLEAYEWLEERLGPSFTVRRCHSADVEDNSGWNWKTLLIGDERVDVNAFDRMEDQFMLAFMESPAKWMSYFPDRMEADSSGIWICFKDKSDALIFKLCQREFTR